MNGNVNGNSVPCDRYESKRRSFAREAINSANQKSKDRSSVAERSFKVAREWPRKLPRFEPFHALVPFLAGPKINAPLENQPFFDEITAE